MTMKERISLFEEDSKSDYRTSGFEPIHVFGKRGVLAGGLQRLKK